MVYDNRHRIFLQTLIQGGAVLDQDALALCVKIFDKKINVSTIATYINNKLVPLAMLMKAGICEITGNKFWSIVGTTHEETIIFPSEFTQSQKKFLQLIYSEIIGANNGCCSSTDCLNLSNTLQNKFSMEEANQFLKNVIKQKYLCSKDGYIYMGVRSIIELMPYFRSTYQDYFNNCFLCKEVVFHGQKCENCDQIFHNYCVVKYINNQNKNICPQCKNSLDISYIQDEISGFESLNQILDAENMDISEETNSHSYDKNINIKASN